MGAINRNRGARSIGITGRDGSEYAAFSPDGTQILTGSSDQTAILWNTSTGDQTRTFVGHAGGINSVAFSADGKRVLTGSQDHTAKLWSVETGSELLTFSTPFGIVSAVAISPNGDEIVTGYGNGTNATLWNANTGKQVRDFTGHTDFIRSIAFSPDGTEVLTGAEDNMAILWDKVTGVAIRTFNRHTNHVNSVAFSLDGTKVLTGSEDKTAKVWEATTGALVRTLSWTHSITSAAFSPNRTKILSGSGDSSAELWPSGLAAITPVPSVMGKLLETAQQTVSDSGLVVGTITQRYDATVPSGQVISQDPPAGTVVSSGSAVSLTASLGPAPIVGTITINNNRSATNSPQVTLALTWSGGGGTGVTRMRFSNDGAHWTAWGALSATRSYTLPSGDGHKTVRVQYRDALGGTSAAISDYIRLDTAPPTGTIIINGGASATVSQSVTLGLTWAGGAGAGVSRMRFSDNGSTWTAWMPPTASRAYMLPAGLGYHTVRVQYLDSANNYSAVYNDYIKLVSP